MRTKLYRIIYCKYIEKMFKKGIRLGKVQPFDDAYYNELSHTIYCTIPVDFDIKHLLPKSGPKKCYDRSFKMFLATKNSVLVRGSLEYFRMKGDDGINHGWVEREDKVYDPTWTIKVDKDFYYKLFKVTDLVKITKKEFEEDETSQKLIKGNITTSLDDFKPNGPKRTDLLMTIPFLEDIADFEPEMRKDLYKYLNAIEYDYDSINKELNDKVEEVLKNR